MRGRNYTDCATTSHLFLPPENTGGPMESERRNKDDGDSSTPSDINYVSIFGALAGAILALITVAIVAALSVKVCILLSLIFQRNIPYSNLWIYLLIKIYYFLTVFSDATGVEIPEILPTNRGSFLTHRRAVARKHLHQMPLPAPLSSQEYRRITLQPCYFWQRKVTLTVLRRASLPKVRWISRTKSFHGLFGTNEKFETVWNSLMTKYISFVIKWPWKGLENWTWN